MTALGAAIADPELIRRRDLAITVSLFGRHRVADRYAYLPNNATGSAPSYQARAIRLDQDAQMNFLEDKEQVIQLLVASGTIFPIFPPQVFRDSQGRTEDLLIIDGGFGHNTPIEAAVDWGATHVIVIEASPEPLLELEPTLLANIGASFDYLFGQAQMIDSRSRGSVEIYTLRPSAEILKTLDFIPALTAKAAQLGEEDVVNGKLHQYSRSPSMRSYSALE